MGYQPNLDRRRRQLQTKLNVLDSHRYAVIITYLCNGAGFGVVTLSGKFPGAWFSFLDSPRVDLESGRLGRQWEVEEHNEDNSGFGLTELRLKEIG